MKTSQSFYETNLFFSGHEILQVHATDKDLGINAKITYYFHKGANSDFKIDPETGVIRILNKLDYDRKNKYQIEMIAEDHGTPPLTGTATLIINVKNINNKAPYFFPEVQKTEVINFY